MLLSLYGDSGLGKSAAQALAASAWGYPEGLKITGDVSLAGLENCLSRSRDQLTWIDDTQQTQNQNFLKQIAYQVAGGTGSTTSSATTRRHRLPAAVAV